MLSLSFCRCPSAPTFAGPVRRSGLTPTRFALTIMGVWTMLLVSTTARSDSPSSEMSTAKLVQAVNATGAGGEGHQAAMRAMYEWLGEDTPALKRLMATLHAMSDANERGKNWLTLTASRLRTKVTDPDALQDALMAFWKERDHDADARYFAYRQLIDLEAIDAEQEAAMLDSSRDDPSVEMRFLAIAKGIVDAREFEDDSAKIELLQTLLPLARHPDHLRQISDRLSDLGVEVDLAKQLAMIPSWYVVASFDNTAGVGFETIYSVETTYANDPTAPVSPDRVVAGGDGPLAWLKTSTDDSVGLVDLNPIYKNEKDAVAYAFCLVKLTDEDLQGNQPAGTEVAHQARLGCINANQVWVNGKKVMSNEVYHSGSSIDQYVAPCELTAGVNSVLIKVCQNNQTEPWAQDWAFQFRLTDQSGRGIPFELVCPAGVGSGER